MPGPARLITLNLGSQTIGLAEFRAAHGGLVLVKYRLREMPLDPETGQRRDAHLALHETAVVLREMMREMQIHGEQVNYAVPAQSVFARFVKLPALDATKIDKVIAFEAQQNVPFPIDEVVWDYQLVGGGLGEQIQVVIVAIKRDLLDEINNAVEETVLRTRIVDVASMALYNAFRYSYPDMGDCSLLLDIGARTTNILFIEPGKFFLRSIPLGGSAITAAIAREFNESFAAAETRQETRRVRRSGRRLRRTWRPRHSARLENRAQHHDPLARRTDAVRHALPRATAGKSAGSHFSLWWRRGHAGTWASFSTRNFRCQSSFSIRCRT